MEFRLSSAKLVGNPSELRWSQVLEHIPQEGTNEVGLGSLYVALSLAKKEVSNKDELALVGKEALSFLESNYYKSNKSPYEALGEALEGLSQKYSFSDTTMEISAASIHEGVAYVGSLSGGEVYLLRGGLMSRIVKSPLGETKTGSGKLAVKDMLILSTPSFFVSLSSQAVEAAKKSVSSQDFAESLASYVHSSDDQDAHALVSVFIAEREGIPNQNQEKEMTVEEAITENEQSEPDLTFQPPKPSLLDKFKNTPKVNFGRKLYVKRGEVEVEESQRRRTAVTVGILLLILLTLSIIFGLFQKRSKEAAAAYDSKISAVQHNLDEAKALFILNPGRARDLFTTSEGLINDLKKEYGEDEKINALAAQLEEGRGKVLGEYDTNVSEFVDLSLIDGFVAEKMSGSVDSVFVYDGAKRRIAEIEIATKNTEVKAGPTQLNKIDAMTSYAGRIYVADPDGIFSVGSARIQVLDKDWSGDILLEAYAGNIYLLEKATSTIWRYVGLQGNFGDRSRWLAPGINIDLSKVVSWAVDGSIWILTASGKIERYSYGTPEDFDQATVVPAMASPKAIYTNEELDNVYVLDPDTERVIVFEKNGKYKAQYKSPAMKDAIGVYASEKEGKILVLSQDKLYSINIEK